jgi:hypothetical protein
VNVSGSDGRLAAKVVGEEARQRAIDVLSESFSLDRIDVDEFERPAELVEKAQDFTQLKTILSDLAVDQEVSRPRAVPLPAEHVPAHSFVMGIPGEDRGSARGCPPAPIGRWLSWEGAKSISARLSWDPVSPRCGSWLHWVAWTSLCRPTSASNARA